MFDVVTIGSATRDVFLTSRGFRVIPTSVFPIGKAQAVPLGAKVPVDEIVFETGGAGTNTAVTFARLGFRTAFLGRVGADDPGGAEILRALRAEGVFTGLVRRDPDRTTAYSIVLMTPKGERTILVYRGAAANLRARDVPSGLSTSWVYVSALGGNLALLRHVFGTARRRGARVAWNPGQAELVLGRAKLSRLLRQVDVLLVNQEEASQLTGVPLRRRAAVRQALRRVVGGTVVVTAGGEGATVLDATCRYVSVPSPVVAKNRTGAGDAFGSGFVAGLLRRPGDVPFALQLGTANAESVIKTFGAKSGLLRRIPAARARVSVRTYPQ